MNEFQFSQHSGVKQRLPSTNAAGNYKEVPVTSGLHAHLLSLRRLFLNVVVANESQF